MSVRNNTTNTNWKGNLKKEVLDQHYYDDSELRWTYLTFVLCGASNIIIWLSILLCLDFFTERYPAGQVPFLFPVINFSILLLVTILMIFIGRKFSLKSRLVLGFSLQLCSLVYIPIIQQFKTSRTNLSYELTLVGIITSSVASAVVQSTMYGLAGVFGSDYLQALEVGKGTAGVMLVLLRIATKYCSSTHPYVAVIEFFTVSFGIVLVATGAVTSLYYVGFSQDKLRQYVSLQRIGSSASDYNASLYENNVVAEERVALLLVDDVCGDSQRQVRRESLVTLPSVLEHVWKPASVLFFIFSSCLACFPGMTTSVPSVTFLSQDWLAVFLVAAFNLGDMLGKALPAVFELLTMKTLHYPVLFQFCFVPFFVWDNISPVGDWFTIFVVLVLGFFTGYVGTSCLMLVPRCCQEQEREMAGMVCSLALILGLFIGSYGGLGLEKMFL